MENQELQNQEPQGQTPQNQSPQQYQEPQSQGTYNSQSQSSGMMQIPLPNATVVLILGIVSIVSCCCYGVIGIICGIVTLIMAKNAKALYDSNPSLYTEGSMSNVNTGRICGIIGLILSILYLLFNIVAIAIYGLAALSNPNALMESIQGM